MHDLSELGWVLAAQLLDDVIETDTARVHVHLHLLQVLNDPLLILNHNLVLVCARSHINIMLLAQAFKSGAFSLSVDQHSLKSVKLLHLAIPMRLFEERLLDQQIKINLKLVPLFLNLLQFNLKL